MRTTEGGGVLGFAIAFLAFAFGGALGQPESVRLLVIGVGVLLAVLSAGMRGFGLAALVLGGIVLVSSISLLGALGASRDQDEVPTHAPSTGTTPPPQEEGGYTLSQHDKEHVDYTWDRSTPAQRRAACVKFSDGLSEAEMDDWRSLAEEYGLPVTEDEEANFRARAEYMVATYC
jgi:hypothetical protein